MYKLIVQAVDIILLNHHNFPTGFWQWFDIKNFEVLNILGKEYYIYRIDVNYHEELVEVGKSISDICLCRKILKAYKCRFM